MKIITSRFQKKFDASSWTADSRKRYRRFNRAPGRRIVITIVTSSVQDIFEASSRVVDGTRGLNDVQLHSEWALVIIIAPSFIRTISYPRF